MSDVSTRGLAVAGAWLLSMGCTGDGAPGLVPSTIEVTEQARALAIEGVAAPDFLRATTAELVLVPDYRAVIGGVDTVVTSADATGVTVTLTRSLPIGSYALDLQAGGRTWQVEHALEVVGTGTGSDAGTVPPDAPSHCPAAPAGCSAFGCPSTASCYYVCAARTQPAASALCRADGLGELVTIDDSAENDCLAAAAQPTASDAVWIGFVQAVNSEEPAEGWGWEVPDRSQFASWGAGQPDDLGGFEDCSVMTVGGTWDDVRCNVQMRYVCERP